MINKIIKITKTYEEEDYLNYLVKYKIKEHKREYYNDDEQVFMICAEYITK